VQLSFAVQEVVVEEPLNTTVPLNVAPSTLMVKASPVEMSQPPNVSYALPKVRTIWASLQLSTMRPTQLPDGGVPAPASNVEVWKKRLVP